MQESIVVVTPTYNEKETLPRLVETIFGLGIPGLRMIVVDDDSPDGTGEIAERLQRKYPIKVIRRREKSGLGTAYIEAFKLILHTNADYIFEIDADLSHDPRDITRFLEKAKNCDLVLGSRYIPGGKIENWSKQREWISRLGNIYARFILGLPYRDITGGFKCYRRRVLESINLETLSSIGYNFQIETTYRSHQRGFRICEIPITFTERKGGSSKFRFGIIFESFWKVLLLRFKK